MSRRAKRGNSEDPEDALVENLYEVKTRNCGYLNVFVKGNIDDLSIKTPKFLTIHDLGTNHEEFHKLVEHPCLIPVKRRSVFIHIDMPGQEYDAIDLPPYFEFPSLDMICDDLIEVLDYFEIEYCVTLGEGAGANILLRFSMKYPDRVMGNILIHPRPGLDSRMNIFQEKIMFWKLHHLGMNSSTDQFLVYHKFGMSLESKKDIDTEQSIKEYLDKLHRRINPKNLRLFMKAYINRTDLTNEIRKNLKVPTMVACGSYPSLKLLADQMQSLMDPKIIHRLTIDHCASILDDAIDVFINNLLLFCQGLGFFSALPIIKDSFSWY